MTGACCNACVDRSFKQEAHTFDSKVRDVFTFVISVNVGLPCNTFFVQVLSFLVDLNYCVW